MKNIKRLTSLLLVLILTYSCTEDITRDPLDELSEAAFFRNAEDFSLFATNFYVTLPRWDDNVENQSDITRGSGLNTVSNGTNTVPNTSGFWNGSYDRLRAVNFLLQKFDEYEDKTSVQRYAGEALWFRAWYYFSLAKTYGGVPIVKRVLDIDSEELYASRNSREEVFTLIINDLEQAIEYLPWSNDVPAKDLNRITKEGAYALLARVCLFEGTWKKFRGGDGNAFLTKAKSASKAVIDKGNYELWHHPELGETWYADLFTLDAVQNNKLSLGKETNKEFIVVRTHSADFDRVPRMIWGDRVSNRLSPTKKLADMYLCTDGLPIDQSDLFQGYNQMDSEYENRDVRMISLFKIPGRQYWSVGALGRNWSVPDEELGDPSTSGGFIYPDGSLFGAQTSTGYTHRHAVPSNETQLYGIDYPVIRFPEILLTYAEASYELNDGISDSELDYSLNIVRERVGMPKLTNDFVSANGLNMRTEIRRERTIEHAYENFRFDDLRRWYTAHIELRKAIKGFTYKGTEWESELVVEGQFDENGALICEEESTREFDKDKNYLFPLPLNELEININLDQNPNW